MPKDIVYRLLTHGSRPVRCLALRFKDVCKRGMKACGINPDTWEIVAEHCSTWWRAVEQGTKQADEQKPAQLRENGRPQACGSPAILHLPLLQQGLSLPNCTVMLQQTMQSHLTTKGAPITKLHLARQVVLIRMNYKQHLTCTIIESTVYIALRRVDSLICSRLPVFCQHRKLNDLR